MIDFSNMEGQQRGPCGADDGKQNTGSDDRYMTFYIQYVNNTKKTTKKPSEIVRLY